MPNLLPTPCNFPGCPETHRSKTGYCKHHRKTAAKQKNQADRDFRGSSRERGYDRRWDKLRNKKRQQDPLCERCLAAGRTKPMDLVHHIFPIKDGGQKYMWSNLQSLCKECHDHIHGRRQRAICGTDKR